MNWNTLVYVVETARQRSFSKAAKSLYIAQPSLSQSIQALERELGTQLFERSHTPIKLTYAGELFVSWAQEALRSREQTMRRIADVTEGTKTRLTVGISYSRSAYLFPHILARFRQLRPYCSVILVEKPANLLSDDDDLDLLIDVPRDESLISTSIILAEERMLLAVPEVFPFRAGERTGDFPVVQLSDYAEQPFILLSEEQMLRKVCLSLCAREGFVPKAALECRSLQTAYAMVGAGVGVTLVPELFVRHVATQSGVYHGVIGDVPSVRKIAVSYRNDRYLTDDAKLLISLMREML